MHAVGGFMLWARYRNEENVIRGWRVWEKGDRKKGREEWEQGFESEKGKVVNKERVFRGKIFKIKREEVWEVKTGYLCSGTEI